MSCARCGEEQTERHHWAPVAIFGADEAERWPTADLCVACHQRWHDVIARRRREDIPAEREGFEPPPSARGTKNYGRPPVVYGDWRSRLEERMRHL